ncbi:MAG: hypothetical protein ABJA98_00400 [Acidobacteriota bacterium]
MATCPKCGDYLGRNHHCWGGRRIVVGTGLLLLGALTGYFAPWLLVDGPSEPLLLVTAALGSVLTFAVGRYTRF